MGSSPWDKLTAMPLAHRSTVLGIALLGAALVGAAPEEDADFVAPPAAEPVEEAPPSDGLPPAPALGPRDPKETLAGALAGALQLVYDQYLPAAKPVPEDVQARLAEEFGPELARARFVVSREAFELLTLFDRIQGTSLAQGAHALTVNDLIVFASQPTVDDLWVWAHELHHVRQYEERGTIRDFALWYVDECPEIERAADERANRVLGTDIQLRHCLDR